MKASRRGRPPLGQHFLRPGRTVERILDAAGVGPGSFLVEIGPGRGALTRPLLGRGARVVAVEVDRRLSDRLRDELPGPELTLVNADALAEDLGPLLAAAGAPVPLTLVGNLPYESATPMVRAFVRRPDLFARLVVMVQREVAARLAARAGDDAYGFLSVDVAAHASARVLFGVAPGEFVPPPKVESAVVLLVPSRGEDPEGDSGALRVASAGFASRRKTLANALGAVWDREAAREAIAAEGLSPSVRAEELALGTFRSLARRLGPPPGDAR